MKHTTTRVLAVIGAALVLMIGGAVAYAAIPSSTGVFTACVHKSSGAVRIIDASKSCSSTEQRFTWNQAGQPGTNGTNGADGVSGREIVVKDGVHPITDSITGTFAEVVSCPDGKVVVGGGAVVGTNAVLGASRPFGDDGWGLSGRAPNGGVFENGDTVSFKVEAICVNSLP